MKKYFYVGAITIAFMGIIFVPSANAQTASTTPSASLLETLKTLMAKVEELKKQLAAIRGEVRVALKAGLAEGMTDEDIKKIQELLATDGTIYPEGKVTGYFGPLTKEALKRFQARHELTATGVVDEETRDLLEDYLKEGFGERVPPGLLKAPGILKKVEMRRLNGCESQKGMGPLCKKLKAKYGQKDDDHEHEDEDDDHEHEDEDFDVEVEIEDGETTISFKFDGEDYEVEVDSTDEDDVLDAIDDELGTSTSAAKTALKAEIVKQLEKAVDESSGDFEVEIEVHGSTTTVNFTFDNDDYEVRVGSTDLEEIYDVVFDETGIMPLSDKAALKEEIEEALDEALENQEDEDFDVEVEVDGDDVTITFTFDGDDYEVEVDSTEADEVLEEVADELDVDEDDIDEDLEDEILHELEEALDDEDEDFEVEVTIDGDTTTVSFTFEDEDYEADVESTDLDDVLEEVADELGVDVEDLDEDLAHDIEHELEEALDDE